jgi:hypothetical protein
MFRPRPTLPRPSGIPCHKRPAWASQSTFHFRQSTSFFSHCYALFCTAQNPNSFRFIAFHTLCTKHPGRGAVAQASACALSSLQPKSTRAFAPPDPFGTLHHPLAMFPLSAFVTILDAASSTSPAFATLTKSTGGGVYPSSRRTSELRLASISCQPDQPLPQESNYPTVEETMPQEYIEIRGARENNLKNIDSKRGAACPQIP